jgi:hypothetical protein
MKTSGKYDAVSFVGTNYGSGYGNGWGYGWSVGNGCGYGSGDGFGYGYGYGYGTGDGYGYGYSGGNDPIHGFPIHPHYLVVRSRSKGFRSCMVLAWNHLMGSLRVWRGEQ